jgi:predicted RNA-binding protein with PIN domain
MRWLIDGMNVIGARADGWWKDRDAAMAGLVGELELWADAQGEDVTVVFERPPRPPIVSELIEVAHAPRPGADAGDDEIVRRLKLADDPEEVMVVTSDKRLAGRAKAIGASVQSTGGFLRRVEETAKRP